MNFSLLHSFQTVPALGPTQPPSQLVLRAVLPEVKRSEREADYSPVSSAEIKNGGTKPLLDHTSSGSGA
jgi:hypothetical protein